MGQEVRPGRKTAITPKDEAQSELLFNRLKKRNRHLKKWARRTGTEAYRIYDRDIPEIPLLLEIYGGAVCGALYKRPYEKDETEEENWLSAMKAAISASLEIDEKFIFLRERRRLKNRQEGFQYERNTGTADFLRDVHEGDLAFRVNLSGYLDTGLFLDARKKRRLILEESSGKRVLNLFAYTCTLSVCAAKGGAASVDSVDLSNTYLNWGKTNFTLNGLKEQPLIRSDVFQFIAEAKKKGLKWDTIILDPPTFSNSKKMKGTLDIKRDHAELIKRCLYLLSPGGRLWFSSNARGLSLDADEYPGFTLKDMGPSLMDEDFKGKRMPLCVLFTDGLK